MNPLDSAVAAAEARLDAGDPVGAARLVEAFEADRGRHERLALVWARLLSAVGNPTVLERQMRTLAAEWPRHPVVALTIAEAGTRWADGWPFDGSTDRLAALAVDILERCLADGRVAPRWAAPLHLARARALARMSLDAEDEALAAFETGLGADPDDATGWADLARLHQVRQRWQKGLDAARHALELDPEHRPARWTAATCATVLAHADASAFWRVLDHLPGGTDQHGRPRVDGLPAVQVSLDPHLLGGAGPPDGHDGPRTEVVWVHPTSPVHGRLASPTVLDLPVDFDDVIAWDPVPRGFREVGEAEVPCFTGLARLAGGRARTWRVHGAVGERLDLPRGWRLYPFGGRISGVDGSGQGKLVTPRATGLDEVLRVVARLDVTLEPG